MAVFALNRFAAAEIEGLGLTPGHFAPLSHGKTHYILLGEEGAPLVVMFHVRGGGAGV